MKIIKYLKSLFINNNPLFIFSLVIYSFLFPASNYSSLIIISKCILSLILFAFLINFFVKTRTSFFKEYTFDIKIYIFFILYILLSLLWTENPRFGWIKFIHLFSQTIFLLSILHFFKQTPNINQLKLMGLIFLISVFLVSVLVIQGDLFFFQNFQITRKSAITHVYAGRLIAIVLLFLLFTNLKISKTVELIIISLLSVALSNTAYRIAILGVIISFITYHLISITKSKKINLRSAHIVFIVSIVISLSISENFKERIPKNEIEELKNDISVIARLEAWKEAVKLWEKNKFVGAGFGSFYSVDENLSPWRKLIYPHNIFLEILAETGIIGLIIFLIGILYSFIETLKSKPFYLGFLIFLFTLSLTSKDITINFVVLIFPYIISRTSSILKDYI